MLQIIEMKINIYGASSKPTKANISFQKLEASDGERVFGITNYENRSFTYNLHTREILEPERKFSLMNGKEYILPVGELFIGKNKELLDIEINKLLKDETQKTNVDQATMNEVMKFVFELHEKHAKQACLNLIDRALETDDRELFERMTEKAQQFNMKGA